MKTFHLAIFAIAGLLPVVPSASASSEAPGQAPTGAADGVVDVVPCSEFLGPPAKDGQLITGVDLSHHQGDVDFERMREAGIHFVVIKATEGIDYVDPDFRSNWEGARRAGISRGAYHFFRAHDDAATQAAFFISTVAFESGDLPPILDVEVLDGAPKGAIHDAAKAWLDAVQVTSRGMPIIYSNLNFARSELAVGFAAYPLWIAEYSEDPPGAVAGWPAWTFWQYTQSGWTEGVSKRVDLSRYCGTVDDFSRLGLK